ncbi:MAG: hypothetical protein ACTHK2_04635 [Dokdonella sp.]|uniref:hypothetical protein n=1 Tax=Dokdonella sp. TaxID=2291710 RepID=UPI003F809D28
MDAAIVSVARLQAAFERARALEPRAPVSDAVAAVAQAFGLTPETVREAIEIDEPAET